MPAPVPPPLALRQLLTGNWATQAVYVAAKLGLADLLRSGPRSAADLAAATHAHARALYRVRMPAGPIEPRARSSAHWFCP